MSYLVGLQCGVTQLVFIVPLWNSAVTDPNGRTLGITENLQKRTQQKSNKNNVEYGVLIHDVIHGTYSLHAFILLQGVMLEGFLQCQTLRSMAAGQAARFDRLRVRTPCIQQCPGRYPLNPLHLCLVTPLGPPPPGYEVIRLWLKPTCTCQSHRPPQRHRESFFKRRVQH